MKIMFAAAECAPFFKSGGLGDVVGALPKALAKKGHEVRVVLPLWRWMPGKFQEKMESWGSFEVKVGWRTEYCGVETLYQDGVRYMFLDNRYYFDRPKLYGYYDDGERFAWFQQAACELMGRYNWVPDVLNCNDYHTAFMPFLLKEKYGWVGPYHHIKTVLTIHNLEFQGEYGREVMTELFGMSPERYDDGTVRYGTAVNFMKAGILYADRVNTVSPSYAAEIQTPEFGCHLDEVLRMENFKLCGILNGIDYDVNNPATDHNLAANYSIKDLKGKAKDKAALQKEFGLPQRPDVPLIGIVSRLTYQKGFQLVVNEMENLMKFDVQVVLLGTGYANFEHDFRWFNSVHHDKFGAKIEFDVGLAQRIYAGADMFLMPSGFEPCGLSQMISMRYGTLPIVHQIGGLKDSVEPYNPITNTGTGFGFEQFSGFYMMEAIKEAMATYQQPKIWRHLMQNAMAKDFSWDKQSQAYLDMYKSLF